MKSEVTIRIRILKGGWKVAEESDESKYVKVLKVQLSIEGNNKKGYFLFMEPEGLFCADNHFDSLDEAINDAFELFGVNKSDWCEN